MVPRTSKIEIEELYWNLCYYDARHPLYNHLQLDKEINPQTRIGRCYCDNCFNGRTKLTLEILRLINED